jgi:ribosomal protein L31E
VPAASIEFVGAQQPALPDLTVEASDGSTVVVEWHRRTVQWWAMWRDAPQAVHFMATDWDFLIDTALMHHAMWSRGQWTLAAEVRLRVAKFGATPEDRARLRMSFADADEKDSRRPVPAKSARERFDGLKAV